MAHLGFLHWLAAHDCGDRTPTTGRPTGVCHQNNTTSTTATKQRASRRSVAPDEVGHAREPVADRVAAEAARERGGVGRDRAAPERVADRALRVERERIVADRGRRRELVQRLQRSAGGVGGGGGGGGGGAVVVALSVPGVEWRFEAARSETRTNRH